MYAVRSREMSGCQSRRTTRQDVDVVLQSKDGIVYPPSRAQRNFRAQVTLGFCYEWGSRPSVWFLHSAMAREKWPDSSAGIHGSATSVSKDLAKLPIECRVILCP
jgi:hypothetical protein